jgi:fermentation-respiration switch protein FrsA (DUF1100 family)
MGIPDRSPQRVMEPGGAGAARRGWRSRVVRALGAAAGCYVGVIIVLLLLENKLLYHPISAAEEWLAPPNNRVQDVQLHAADGTAIHAWWCPVDEAAPARDTLLYCHGNAGNLSHRTDLVARWQKQLGVSVLIFDYPGYGKSGGNVSEAGCYAAADAAYDWLIQQQQISPECILLYGGSLGAAVAVDLASRRPIQGLILVGPFASIPIMAQKQFPWLPARWLVRNRFDNLAKIGKCGTPIFIAHGTADRLVPFTQGMQVFDSAGEPKQFFILEGHDHNDPPGPEFYAAVRTFLSRADAGRRPAVVSPGS